MKESETKKTKKNKKESKATAAASEQQLVAPPRRLAKRTRKAATTATAAAAKSTSTNKRRRKEEDEEEEAENSSGHNESEVEDEADEDGDDEEKKEKEGDDEEEDEEAEDNDEEESSYELERKRRMEENQRFLQSLGLLDVKKSLGMTAASGSSSGGTARKYTGKRHRWSAGDADLSKGDDSFEGDGTISLAFSSAPRCRTNAQIRGRIEERWSTAGAQVPSPPERASTRLCADQGRKEVNPRRIALGGSSSSGGGLMDDH